MVETIVLFINGQIRKVEALVSKETRTVQGQEYHLVVHTKTKHQSLCTKENLKRAKSAVAESTKAMEELASTM
jgi:hypothetical protein|tara:strand:+ start:695 stop:913 length:219 start_codon:yes stop_codon:yes gene_type:complete